MHTYKLQGGKDTDILMNSFTFTNEGICSKLQYYFIHLNWYFLMCIELEHISWTLVKWLLFPPSHLLLPTPYHCLFFWKVIIYRVRKGKKIIHPWKKRSVYGYERNWKKGVRKYKPLVLSTRTIIYNMMNIANTAAWYTGKLWREKILRIFMLRKICSFSSFCFVCI